MKNQKLIDKSRLINRLIQINRTLTLHQTPPNFDLNSYLKIVRSIYETYTLTKLKGSLKTAEMSLRNFNVYGYVNIT